MSLPRRPARLIGIKGNVMLSGHVPRRYGTRFEHLYEMLRDHLPSEKRRGRDLSIRGICRALGIDTSTFHRYRSGLSRPPEVVLDQLATLYGNGAPPPDYWNYCALKITPKLQEIGYSGRQQVMLEIEFADENELEPYQSTFCTKNFAVRINRKFRQVLFENTERTSPPVEKFAWEEIVDRAINGGFAGCNTEAERSKRRPQL